VTVNEADLERVKAALERVSASPVQMIPLVEWNGRLREGGKPTLLDSPFRPYRGIEGNRGFGFAVASGAPFADTPGFHHVRHDMQDAPDVVNTDSYDVITDLTTDGRWSDVLRISGCVGSRELKALIRQHVFAVKTLRHDHHSAEVPEDIGSALPKDENADGEGKP